MSDHKASAEALLTQLPLDDVKRILTQRFAQEVKTETFGRLWRTIAGLGVPSVLLVVGLAWKQLENSVTIKVSEQKSGVSEEVIKRIDPEIHRIVRSSTDGAFRDQRGDALRSELIKATEAQEFKTALNSIVNATMQDAWTRESPRFRNLLLGQLSSDEAFRKSLANDVEQALSRAGSVDRIIAVALQESLHRQRGDDRGQIVPLALLAALDQQKANEVVMRLLDQSKASGSREVAIGALATVNFTQVPNENVAASAMLSAALDAWEKHCEVAACKTDRVLGDAMATFLRRGRELGDVDRAEWVRTLREWHEKFIASSNSPSQEASFRLVPRALAEIGKADAIQVLKEWSAFSGNTDLALSSTEAIADLPPDRFPNLERLTLFRTLWARVTADDGIKLAVEEAAWMAIGQISRGEARPTNGPWMLEARLASQYLSEPESSSTLRSRSALAEWVNTPFRRQAESNPPDWPCSLSSDSRARFEGDERAARRQAEICALVALLRVRTGAMEWYALRPPLVQQQHVTLLGLLWAHAAGRERGSSDFVAADRFAPLNDLLLSRQIPTGFQLAAQLLLRSVPDREAWQAMTVLPAQAADANRFTVATRWMYRSHGDDLGWFIDQLAKLPRDRQTEVLDALINGVLPDQSSRGSTPTATPVMRLHASTMRLIASTASTRQALTTEMANALMLSASLNKSHLLEAAEGGDLFGRLQGLMEGREQMRHDRNRLFRSTLEELQARLLQESGWKDAIAALGSVEATGLPAQLAPTHGGRYGRLRIADGDIVELMGPEDAQITLFHSQTHQTRTLRVNAPWPVERNSRVMAEKDAWLFRAAMPTQGVRLEVRIPEPITLVRRDNDSRAPPLTMGVFYRIAELPANTPGFARIEGVKLGERLSITTSNLGPDVDTKVAVRDALTRWIEDDDGGDGYASRLNWINDQTGPVLLKIENIGQTGEFNIRVTRQ